MSIDTEQRPSPVDVESPPDRRRQLQWGMPTPWGLFVGVAVVLIGFLVIVPLFVLVQKTLSGPGGLSLDGFQRAYGGGSLAGDMVFDTFIFGLGSTVLAVVVGTALAYVYVRTDAPFKRLLFVASLGPLIIPGFLYTAAWIFLADPKMGLLNTALLKPVLGADVSIYSMGGMVWVQALHITPICFILMVTAFRAMDPSLEESALVGGASRLMLLRRVTLPLMRPGLAAAVLLVFIQSIESFDVPAILGEPAQIYVFTSRIYLAMQGFPVDYGVVGAYAITLLGVAVSGVLLSSWFTRDARKYQTVVGKSFRPRTVPLGRVRAPVACVVLLYVTVSLILPVLVLVWGSLLPYYQEPAMDALADVSLTNYAAVVTDSAVLEVLKTTVLVCFVSATAVTFLSALASWVVVRTKVPGRRLLDALTFTPLVIPGVVLGLALLLVYVRIPWPIYGTMWILVIAYATRFLPYAMRMVSVAMMQLAPELEESALVSGAGRWRTFRRVLMPLMSNGLVGAWVFVFVVAFRELSSTILLYTPGNEVLSVLMYGLITSGQWTTVAAMGVLMVGFSTVLVMIVSALGGRVGVAADDHR